MRQAGILSHVFNLYNDSLIRELEIEELDIKTGGKLVYYLRYADDIALGAEPHEADVV